MKNILAIESTCDETSAAVIKVNRGLFDIASNVVVSQINIHKKYGGVVPEIAAREHVRNINFVVDQAISEAKIKKDNINLLAVASGPGLMTSLIVGVEAAKALSLAWKIPLVGVNHMYGHIAGNFLSAVKFPAVCLVVSGGHSDLILLKNYDKYKKIGQTVDDAAGEAFDKVAKLMDLGYPGGPIVSAKADNYNKKSKYQIKLPRPMIDSDDFNFSFSGLKTAVLYQHQKQNKKTQRDEKYISALCYEFQEAVVDVLVNKTIKATKKHKAKTVLLAGGVGANKRLRNELEKQSLENGLLFNMPEFKLCTDNAAMIGLAAYHLTKGKKIDKDNWRKVKADPGWEL